MVAVTGCSTEELGSPGAPDPTDAPLLRPAAGEVITIGTKQPIQWTPSGDVAAVDVHLTLPDGSVQIIAEDVPNEGSYQWSVPLVYSQATRAYTISVLPSDSAGEPRSLPIQGVRDHLTVGSIAGFKWNGANEEYYWIDLVTGESQVIGTVGDLTLWEWKGASAFDASNGLIYAVGAPDDSTSVRKIYTFDAATGALISDTVLQGPHPSGLKVNASGQVLGMPWNGIAAQESARALERQHGYHPRFKVPAHYPRVPRLGFNWRIGDTVVIKGQPYFALCAHAVMAGGALEIS
jgi:hypothetical protein